jgi:carotenoid cleavage dioxygenase-like enzyme
VKDGKKWGPNQCLVKYDVSPCANDSGEKAIDQVYYYGERCFVQEPIFAAKPNAVDEDDGYILQLVNDAGSDETFLYIFDAKNIEAGKGYECKIQLMDEHVPPGLHGYWSPPKK